VSVMGHYLGDDNNGLVIVMCYTMKKEGGKWKIAGFECSQPSLSDIPPPPMQELKQ
jgi:hypothetical protein